MPRVLIMATDFFCALPVFLGLRRDFHTTGALTGEMARCTFSEIVNEVYVVCTGNGRNRSDKLFG
jgi:hypothetical protein